MANNLKVGITPIRGTSGKLIVRATNGSKFNIGAGFEDNVNYSNRAAIERSGDRILTETEFIYDIKIAWDNAHAITIYFSEGDSASFEVMGQGWRVTHFYVERTEKINLTGARKLDDVKMEDRLLIPDDLI